MGFHVADQLKAALAFFILGTVSSFAYDALSFAGMLSGVIPIRKDRFSDPSRELPDTDGAPRRRIAVRIAGFFADVVLSVVAAIVFSVASYVFCEGAFRFYTLFFAVLGFALYRAAPGRVTRRVFAAAAYYIRYAVGAAAGFALRPLRRLGVFVVRTAAGVLSAAFSPVKRLCGTLVKTRRLRSAEKRLRDVVSFPVHGENFRRERK